MARWGSRLLLVGLGALAAASPASGAVISVTTTADQFGGGAKCALREALRAAYDNAPLGGCPTGSGSTQDVVRLRGTETYRLTRARNGSDGFGALFMGGDVTLRAQGRGGPAVIDGSGANDSIIDVAFSSNVIRKVRISGGIADGAGGGAVSVGGGSALRISDSSLVGNNGGSAGGAIVNFGNVTILRTTISGNRAAGEGGAIYHFGPGQLIVRDSTLSGNRATGLVASGGGLAVAGGTAGVLNSTISGNRADGGGGGVYLSSGTLLLGNATLTKNVADADGASGGSGGGYARSGGSSGATNTIIARNSAGTSPDCAGTLNLTYSLLGDSAGCTGFTAPTNVINDAPRLKSLADNGGSTKTHALRVGSPARNAGNPAAVGGGMDSCLPRDQRGVRRPQQGRCDIGSFEYERPRR